MMPPWTASLRRSAAPNEFFPTGFVPTALAHSLRCRQVRAGETLVSVAARYGTTVTDLVELNYNTITHIQNPIRVIARIQNPIRALCAHPSAQDASQAQWAPATGLPPCEAGRGGVLKTRAITQTSRARLGVHEMRRAKAHIWLRRAAPDD
mmetsp:Transcript_74129/g.197653  ORF Transcript_74129/g.197653 Transcript_74129/m.197653 type:complete len:151 (-) Transcript_74129:259-711(-)